MRRLLSICIIIILLRTIYMYASTVENDWSETENNMAEEALPLDKAVSYYGKMIHDMQKLDIWLGEYCYTETFEHNSGEINYFISIDIIIYKVDSKYYAELEGNGWFLQTRSLAYIKGDENSIDILFKKTLPGDSLCGEVEHYEEDELMLTFTYDNSELKSSWHALRQEHPVLCESEENIEGVYFIICQK